MRSRAVGSLLVLSCLGCGDNKIDSSCVGVCTAPSWTTLELVAGQPGGCGHVDGGPLVVHLDSPSAVTGDGAGHVYVLESTTIRTIDVTTGNVAAFAGTFGVVGATDGPAGSASFNSPSGIVATPTKIYVADTENHTIRSIDLGTKQTTTIAGAENSAGAVDDIGVAARFREPEGLALANGQLYIADTDNHTIRVMDIATGAVSTLAGVAQTSGTTDGIGAMARFDRPAGMLLDGSQDLYVIDRDSLSVRHVDLTTAEVSTLVTFETEPHGLAIVGGQLFVSIADGRIFTVELSTATPTLVAGAKFMPGVIDGNGTDARFLDPAGLFADGTGAILVADPRACALRSLGAADHVVSTKWGGSFAGTADGGGTAARFADPQGLIVAPTGTIYVADTNNHTVRAVDPSGLVTTIAGAAGEPGAVDGIGGDARFDSPSGLALDDAGMLYIADTGNQAIRQLDPTTGVVTTLDVTPASSDSFTSFRVPRGLAIAGATLFVTDGMNDTVLAIDLDAREIRTLAGTPGVKGGDDGRGELATFDGPLGIVADGRDHLYVADVNNHTIRTVRVSTGEVTTLAGKPKVLGARDGTGDDARFGYPSYLAVDGLGDLFVSDIFNKTVRQVDVASGAVTTVIGVPAQPGVMLGTLPAQLGQPWAIALTGGGDLIVVSESSLLRAR